ncbi:MAG: STAS domain-containing protein [Spirochaetales bacterium]|nr:STAS domain-containing protein [Spirochaetales bacterium]
MEIKEKMIPSKSVYLIEVKGELDLYGAPDFRKRVIDRINNTSNKVLFDLSGMTYIDSSGVGAFIKILQELKKAGGDHRVIHLQGGPRQVFRLSNIISLIKESENKSSAADSLGGQQC